MSNVCGLNMHKDSVYMCIGKENSGKIEEKFGVFTNNPRGKTGA